MDHINRMRLQFRLHGPLNRLPGSFCQRDLLHAHIVVGIRAFTIHGDHSVFLAGLCRFLIQCEAAGLIRMLIDRSDGHHAAFTDPRGQHIQYSHILCMTVLGKHMHGFIIFHPAIEDLITQVIYIQIKHMIGAAQDQAVMMRVDASAGIEDTIIRRFLSGGYLLKQKRRSRKLIPAP